MVPQKVGELFREVGSVAGFWKLAANRSQTQKILRFWEKIVVLLSTRPLSCISKSTRFTGVPWSIVTSARFPKQLVPYSSSESQNVSRMAPWSVFFPLEEEKPLFFTPSRRMGVGGEEGGCTPMFRIITQTLKKFKKARMCYSCIEVWFKRKVVW